METRKRGETVRNWRLYIVWSLSKHSLYIVLDKMSFGKKCIVFIGSLVWSFWLCQQAKQIPPPPSLLPLLSPFLLPLLFFGGVYRVFLCGHGCSGAHSVDPADLEFRDLPSSASPAPGVEVWTTTLCSFPFYSPLQKRQKSLPGGQAPFLVGIQAFPSPTRDPLGKFLRDHLSITW